MQFETKFLSTLSLRRATAASAIVLPARGISIHALLAESDAEVWEKIEDAKISIHALLAESDLPAVKRATDEFGISIHTLLAESD